MERVHNVQRSYTDTNNYISVAHLKRPPRGNVVYIAIAIYLNTMQIIRHSGTLPTQEISPSS